MTETRANIAKPAFVLRRRECVRCGGTGVYGHYGVCFRCGGCGIDPRDERVWAYPTDWTDEQVQAAEDRKAELKARREDRKAEKIAAHLAAFAEEHPAEYAVIDEADNAFMISLKCQLHSGKDLTVGQMEAVTRGVERDAVRAAERAAAPVEVVEDLPTGKGIEIEGQVVSTKWQDGDYGSTFKMLVKGQGWKVWSTVPAAAMRLVQDNDEVRIRFVADVEASRQDPAFGIAKRPRKVEAVEEQAA